MEDLIKEMTGDIKFIINKGGKDLPTQEWNKLLRIQIGIEILKEMILNNPHFTY